MAWGYLAAKNDAITTSELKREQREVEELPEVEAQECWRFLKRTG